MGHSSNLRNYYVPPRFIKVHDLSRPLQTDASDRGVGAVLSQRDDKGQEHPVSYESRKFLPQEQRYSTVEKALLATKLATNAFRIYWVPLQ